MNEETIEMVDKIVEEIIKGYEGLVIGDEAHTFKTEQLRFRLRRTLVAALNNELETELPQ